MKNNPILKALIVALLIGMVAWLSSCAAGKMRKDQKALNRVLGNDELLARAAKRAYQPSDTTRQTETVFIEGLVDGPMPVFNSDSAAEAFFKNLVFATDHEIDTTIQGIRVLVGRGGIRIQGQLVTEKLRIVDRGLARAWQDSANKYKQLHANAMGRNEVLEREKQLAEAKRLNAERDLEDSNEKLLDVQGQLDATVRKLVSKGKIILFCLIALAIGYALGKMGKWAMIASVGTKLIGAFRRRDKKADKKSPVSVQAFGMAAPAVIDVTQAKPAPNGNDYIRIYPLAGDWWQYQVIINDGVYRTSNPATYADTLRSVKDALKVYPNYPVIEHENPL